MNTVPTEPLARFGHDHVFDSGSHSAERGARTVMWITLVMMVIEIGAGYWFNSMALLADGWHMSSHALAIGLSALAYASARKYARDARFAFGTWKIEILAGYTSAIFLLGIAALMVFSSVERIWSPQPIHYQEAIVIGVVGLVVNIVCAVILGGAHDHGHDHGHAHGHDAHGHHHDAHGHDLNLKSAYVHVLADAATSVLAIAALCGGWALGWAWLDPVMGIVGAVVVAVWAKNLIVQTGKVLLDREMDHPVVQEIREAVEVGTDADATRVVDLHVWRVGKMAYSCAVSVVTNDATLTPEAVSARIRVHEEVVHTTIEIRSYG
jgi:cation diffusion facilitator family transporter